MRKIGALEGGGTKMVLAVYTEEGQELERLTLPTETPEKTLPPMIAFFRKHQVDALGVASFGPVDLNPDSPTYGSITSTPKPGWKDFPLLKTLLDGQDIPVGFDNDVNAAAIAEAELGAARGCRSSVYVTVGTGIGAGVMVDGKVVHGLVHPEVGHMLLRPHKDDPNPHGVCPYHDGCLEGLAAGPGLGARVGGDARDLPDDHPTFAIEAHYLAQMCVNLIVTVSPERIILGGGVMQRTCLLPLVRAETVRLLNGYVQSPMITEKIDEYIVAPELYPVSGLVGSYLLGKRALEAAN